MLATIQALAGIAIIVCVSLMAIYWTKMGRFAAPVVKAIKKGRDLAQRRRDLS